MASSPSTLAITGATGFVGAATLDAALAAGHQVKALTRREQAERAHTEWIQGTLDDTGALERLIRGCDAVIHIAGLTNTPDLAEFEQANVTGTANVIAAAKAAGVKRFIFVSSLSAREPQLSAYGASKAKAEELVQASTLDWTAVRPPAVYGPRDNDMLDLFKAARFGVVPLPPGGATSIIHVDDLAALLLVLATSSSAPTRKKLYEPDDGREGGWSHKELAQAIGQAVGRKRVSAIHLPKSVLELAAGADRLLRGDSAKLTYDRVGYMAHPNWVARSSHFVPAGIWQPRIGGLDGLSATARWYEAEGWL